MSTRLLRRFKKSGARDTSGTSAEHRDRCWYKQPMLLDFWQTLIAALERIAMLPSLIHKALPSLSSRKRVRDAVRTYDRTMDDMLREVQRLLEASLDPTQLLHMSGKLHDEFAPKLAASDICMLPSYNDKLPTGREQGTYLALDVGGSTFRVAVVELNGHKPGAKSMRIVNMKSYKIDNSVRYLRGTAFFDWMAEKIETAITDPQVRNVNATQSFSMGLAWSFPVEYVSCPRLLAILIWPQANVDPQRQPTCHGQGFSCDRRHVGSRSVRADHGSLQETKPPCQPRLNHQRLFSNAIVTCVRGPCHPLCSDPRHGLQHLRAPTHFHPRLFQVQGLPAGMARRSKACPRQHRA
jgi:hypothetical protein